MDSMERLRTFALEVRDSGDAAGMCRVGVFNELCAGDVDRAKGWFTRAAGQAFVPALHQLTRLAVNERNFSRAHSLLGQIGLMLREDGPEDQNQDLGPVTPPRDVVTAAWVVDSDWVGETGWVGLAPDVLGVNWAGQPIPFDWAATQDEPLGGFSTNAETFTVVTSDVQRARAALDPVVTNEMSLLNLDGERVASFDEPFRIKLPSLDETEVGLEVSFDARGEVTVSLARVVISLLGSALRTHRVAAHIANLWPAPTLHEDY